MEMRWGPGPVFVYESIAATRRRQLYAQRAGFVLSLLVCLALIALSLSLNMEAVVGGGDGHAQRRFLSQLGSSFYYTIATVQIALILVAAPAATAGAICLDRARGSMTHMLVTDLSDAEIVIGKLGASLLPVLGLVVAAVPVLALAALLGGIIPEALLTLTLLSLALALFGCSFAMAVSARVTKSTEVLMVVMMTWVFWNVGLLFWTMISPTRVPQWLLKLNPFVLAWGPYAWPNWVGFADVLIYLAVMGIASLLLVIDTVRRLRVEPRKARQRQLARWGFLSTVARLIPRQKAPTLDANPVLWREWHRARPSKLTRFVWGVYWVCAAAGTAWAVFETLSNGPHFDDGEIAMVGGVQITVGLLLVSLTAPSALAEERTQGSLDVLMATPLSTHSIVWGKWWGAFRVVPALALLPVIGAALVALVVPLDIVNSRDLMVVTPTGAMPTPMTVTSSYTVGLTSRMLTIAFSAAVILAQGAVCTSLGLALATWIRRPGRATAVCVSLYTVFAFGWPILMEMGLLQFITWLAQMAPGGIFADPFLSHVLDYSLIALCPLGGQIMPTEVYQLEPGNYGSPIFFESGIRTAIWWLGMSLTLWLLVTVAATLYALMLLSFERCLGRASEHPRTVRTAPRPKIQKSRGRRLIEALT